MWEEGLKKNKKKNKKEKNSGCWFCPTSSMQSLLEDMSNKGRGTPGDSFHTVSLPGLRQIVHQ